MRVSSAITIKMVIHGCGCLGRPQIIATWLIIPGLSISGRSLGCDLKEGWIFLPSFYLLLHGDGVASLAVMTGTCIPVLISPPPHQSYSRTYAQPIISLHPPPLITVHHVRCDRERIIPSPTSEKVCDRILGHALELCSACY